MAENNYAGMIQRALDAAQSRPWEMSPFAAVEALARRYSGDLLFPLERRDRYKAAQLPAAADMLLSPLPAGTEYRFPMLYPEHLGHPGVSMGR